MNWLDGIIGFISPEWGARREAWRQSLTEMRNYDAGNYDRGNANWRVLNQSAEFTDRYSRDNVRARARDLERNSDMMNSVIGAYKRNVIGGGYALQAKTGSDKTNEIIQTAWIPPIQASDIRGGRTGQLADAPEEKGEQGSRWY